MSSGIGPVYSGFLPLKECASNGIATFQNLSPTNHKFRGRMDLSHSARGIDPSS